MDHELAPEVSELRRTVRAFLERKSSETDVRRIVDGGLRRDDDVWRQMAGQLGLQGLLVPESFGGQGTSFVEIEVVLEELGRSLLPAPFLSSAVLAVSALMAVGDDAVSADLLPGLAEGRTTATVAFSEGFVCRPGESTVSARRTGSGWVLDGQVDAVLDGASAETLLVVAPTEDGLGLFAVGPDRNGVTDTELAVLDPTRPMAAIDFHAASARRVGGDFTEGQRWLLALGAAAVSAELAGATQKVLETAVEYARLREQFGKQIGSFQAVKHLCADIFVTAESALSVARHAARTAADNPASLAEVASLAKAYSSEACALAAEQNIQVHGGIGFTWEHPAHLYLRRAKSGELLFGDSAHHRGVLAGLLGLTGVPAQQHVPRALAHGEGDA